MELYWARYVGSRAALGLEKHRNGERRSHGIAPPRLITSSLAAERIDEPVIRAPCHPGTYMATTMVRQSGVTPISTVEEAETSALLFWW